MILDVCCGSLQMYHDREVQLEDFVYIDVRVVSELRRSQRTTFPPIQPLVRADMRYLPFKDNLFSAIICDPPHQEYRKTSLMRRKYGSWAVYDVVRHMREANAEFARVLRDHGLLLLKIMRSRLTLYEEILSNFRFFLPIVVESRSYVSKEKIVWLIGEQAPPPPAGTIRYK